MNSPAQQPQAQAPIAAEISARKQLIRASAGPRRAIYGAVGRVSGNLLYVANGTDTGYVHFVIALADHSCQAINDGYLGDEKVGDLDAGGNVTTGRFAGHVRIKKYLGSLTQVMDAELAAECPEWGAKDRPGKGITYVYLRIKRSRDVFPQGIPTPRFDVQGKNDILDVRTGTRGYTQNAALCSLDYVLWERGFGSALDEVVQADWIAAANVCDEDVAVPGGGTQKRYAINGSFTTDRKIVNVLDEMRQAMAGGVNYTMGLWYAYAGAASAPVMDISERDLRGPYRVRPRVTADTVYNGVKGTYTETSLWTETDFPPVKSATYLAQDNGRQKFKEVRLAFETDPYRAQRLAKTDLERHRQEKVVELPMRIKGLGLRPGNVVRLSLKKMGYVNKLFRVVKWNFNLFGGPDLVLEGYEDAIYTWSSLDAVVVGATPNTALPNPFVAPDAPGTPAVTESLYETTGSVGVRSRATVSWVSSALYRINSQLEYRRVGDAAWTVRSPTAAQNADLDDLAPGRYEFRVRDWNALAVPSDFSAVTTAEILGLTAAPASPTGFSVVASNGHANAVWALTPDLDVRIGGRAVVRWTPLTSGAVWENGVDIPNGNFPGAATQGTLPLLTGTYLLKFQDSTENWSTSCAAWVLTAGNLVALLNSQTLTEHPAFSGAKSSTVLVAGSLQLDSASAVDSIVANIDTWSNIDSIGGVAAVGTYDASAAMDFGAVATRRFTVNVLAQAFDTGDMIDARGDVDDWDSVDGTVINDATATVLAAISNDAISYGAWFPFMGGDLTSRAARFRLQESSAAPTHNVGVNQFSVTAQW
ncbi:MAG: hypothetical protein Q7U97_06720 [Rhodocyclaceae bacterium]|nr:hypothetical protein [Rhodocyclaceae bacterium]